MDNARVQCTVEKASPRVKAGSEVDSSKQTSASATATTPSDKTFTDEEYKLLTALVFDEHSAVLQSEIVTFLDSIGAKKSSDLHHMDEFCADFTKEIDSSSVLNLLIIKKRLIKVLRYMSIRESRLSPGLTYEQVETDVSKLDPPPAQKTKNVKTLDSQIEFVLHDLPPFSGYAKDYGLWKRCVKLQLGMAAISSRVIYDENFHSEDPATSERVYSAMSAALLDGCLGHLAHDYSRHNNSAHKLFLQMEATLNTPITRASLVIPAMRKLVNLRLENHSSVNSFLSEFRRILDSFQDNGIKLSDIQLILWGSFIGAIPRCPEFREINEWLIDHPDESIHDCLFKLNNWDWLREVYRLPPLPAIIGFDASKLRSDADHPAKKQKRQGEFKHTPWKIPPFPNSWKKLMTNGRFQLLVEWRNHVNKNSQKPVLDLVQKFEVVT